MASLLDNLIARQAQAAAELAALGAKPSYSLDGESIDWDRHRESLVKEIDDLQKLIITLEGPSEAHVQGLT